MPAQVVLRALSPEERRAVEVLAGSRTAPARSVERARIIQAAARGLRTAAIARDLGISRPTVYTWIKRYNLQGPAGLHDMPRSGRPATYPPEQVAEVLAAALSDPRELGLDHPSWTLDRLQDYLNAKGIGIKRSRIDEILLAEGLRWRQHEGWFGERVDPDFARKRGRSSGSTSNHPRAQPSSASTRWGRSSPRPTPASGSSAPPGAVEPDGTRRPAGRARRPLDAGKRRRGGYVYGAFRPATGEAMTHCYERRRGADFLDFLERVDAWVPPEVDRVYVILDNLQSHHTTDVLLFALGRPRWEFVYQPTYAAYLNLIEPWWKVLKSLALEGRRFATWEEMIEAFAAATAYWNRHRHPFVWGRRRRHQPRRRPGIARAPRVTRIAG